MSMWWPEPSQLSHCRPRVASGDSRGVPRGSGAQRVPAASPRSATALSLHCPSGCSAGSLCMIPARAVLLDQPLPEQQQQQPMVPAGAEGPRAIFATGAKHCQSHPALCLAPHRHFPMAEGLADNKKLSASQGLSRLFLFNVIFNLNVNLIFKP